MRPPGRHRPKADVLRQATDSPQGLSVSGLSPKGEYRSAKHEATPVMPLQLDAAGIAARVPHQGRMCLLQQMIDCGPTHIHCLANNHSDPDHPLRLGGCLPAASAIEYAAQAMALHATVRAQSCDAAAAPQPGFLASARAVTLHVPRLDDAPGPLQVRATHMLGDAGQAQYRFSLHDANERLLVDGRATVVLNKPLRPPSADAAT